MVTHNILQFLRRAHADSKLADQVRSSDTYEALAELAGQTGIEAPAGELRIAFAARGGRTLGQLLLRRGLVDCQQLPPAPEWNQQAWDAVAALDLSPVVTQLVNRKGWTAERAASCERRYRGFLYMIIAVPGLTAIPTVEIDEFWHQHILNTKRYALDCRQIYDCFIHHSPASGTDSEELEAMGDRFFDTWLCYEALFGEPYEETIGAALLQRWPKLAEPAAA